MEHSYIISKVKKIFHSLFGEHNEFNEDTSSSDVHGWDSLKHVVFISKIEEEFGFRFSLDEMQETTTIGDICRIIDSKTTL